MPLFRWSEPYFFDVCLKTLKQIFSRVFCCRRVSEREQIDHSSLLERGLFTNEVKVSLDDNLSDNASAIEITVIEKGDKADPRPPSLSSQPSADTSMLLSQDGQKNHAMQPLFLFLTSSLNVELVYCILKGITQFGYITLCDEATVRPKLSKMAIVSNERDGSMSLTFFEIKIKNYSDWRQEDARNLVQDSWVKSRKTMMREKRKSVEPTDMKVIKQQVKVTFHMIEHFKALYEHWSINDFDSFYESLSPKFNREMVFKAGQSAGSSGSFFFFSHDSKFIVKTMTSSELARLKRMMPNYSEHLKTNKNSLLSKILGIFTVKTENFSSVHIMLMENTVRLKESKNLRYIFDLKGSTVDRVVGGRTKPQTTLKDINFLVAKKRFKHLTSLDDRTTRRLVHALRNDVEFLR